MHNTIADWFVSPTETNLPRKKLRAIVIGDENQVVFLRNNPCAQLRIHCTLANDAISTPLFHYLPNVPNHKMKSFQSASLNCTCALNGVQPWREQTINGCYKLNISLSLSLSLFGRISLFFPQNFNVSNQLNYEYWNGHRNFWKWTWKKALK